jgi:hypothetical protein
VSFEDRRQLLEPGLGPDSFGPDTFAVHLWAKELRRLVMSEHGGQPPSGSFLAWAIDRARRDGFIPS